MAGTQNPVRLCYFVGNSNGRGLVRIEIDGRNENAGFHICSATRGREAWVASLVERWNLTADLMEAAQPLLRAFDEAMKSQAKNMSDAKLIVIANYGDLALDILRAAIAKATRAQL